MLHKRPKVILIGASTGGIEALTFLLKELPINTPPILISQHILPNFCQSFALQLSKTSSRPTTILSTTTELFPGNIYIQHPETTLFFKTSPNHIICTPKINFGASVFRPCIDDAFTNFSKTIPKLFSSLTFLLTGMGSDGANGLLSLKNAGHFTIAQDRASSLVYGMPKVAMQIGAANQEMSLLNIRENILFLS